MFLPSIIIIMLFLHLNHSWAVLSSIGSPQIKLFLHRLWIISLPFNRNGDPKPSGSYIVLNAARTTRRAAYLSFILIMNLKVSSWMFHFTPSPLSSGWVPRFNSLYFTISFLYSSVFDFNSSILLLETITITCQQLSLHLGNFPVYHLQRNSVSWQMTPLLHFSWHYLLLQWEKWDSNQQPLRQFG